MLFDQHMIDPDGRGPGLRRGRVVISRLLASLFAINILVASFMPGAKASHPDAKSSLTVLCTPTGPKLVKADDGQASFPDESAAEKSCDFCLPFTKLVLHAPNQKPEFMALNLAINRLHFPDIGITAVPIASTRPLQPRAPPLLSA